MRDFPPVGIARTATIALLGALYLSACGGGGGGSAMGGSSSGSGGSGYGGGTAAPKIATLAFSGTAPMVGEATTLSWSTTGATSCSASGSWSGSEPLSGSLMVTPTAAGSFTYTLSCSGAGGSTSKSVTLTVGAAAGGGPYTVTSLVANGAGTHAVTVDANLSTPWGIVFASSGPVWISNFMSQTSTLYDGDGKAQPVSSPLVVKLPPGASGQFYPTGIVANAGTSFVVSAGGKSGAASFIYVGEGGMIAGWASGVDATSAVAAYVDTGGAAYTGATLASNAGQQFLYAADFHNGKIDVFDGSFTKQTSSATSFAFQDPSLPKGYAPFGIQALPTGSAGAAQIYVTYAQTGSSPGQLPMTGAGLGLVDVFDTNGQLVARRISVGGALNAPWGVALAPASFGSLGGHLLIGNFGDGKINAFDSTSGALTGPVTDDNGTAVVIPQLWGIAFGNGSDNQPANTLFYAASDNGGEYGRIDVGATAPTLNAPPVVSVSAPASTVSGTVTLTAQVTDSLSVSSVKFLEGTTVIGTATAAPFTIQWNTTTVANGTVSLSASATDADGNVGKSATLSVTVDNTAAPPPASTLTELQAQIFGPVCSGCHDGVGTSLPGVQNLTSASATYKSLVGVASIEQPNVLRVKPNDPDGSSVIEKLEGAAGITGARMPFGGPYLTQAQINMIESWINAGAPDD